MHSVKEGVLFEGKISHRFAGGERRDYRKKVAVYRDGKACQDRGRGNRVYRGAAKKILGRASQRFCVYYRGIMRYSDDGEPAGTAGLPVLDCIKKEGLSNIAVVVTRYFGGILLGTGGLVHAYSKAAKEGIAAALPVDMALCTEVSLFCDYTLLGKIQNELCRGNVLTGDTVYTDSVKVCAFVPVSDTENFVKNMTDKTNGQVRIEIGKTGYKKYI